MGIPRPTTTMQNTPWEQIVAQKQSDRDQLLAPYFIHDVEHRVPRVQQVDLRSRLDVPEVQSITDIDNIPRLLHQLQMGKFTAEQVVLAYIRRYDDPRNEHKSRPKH